MKILHVVPGLNEGGNGIAVAAKLIAEGQGSELIDCSDCSIVRLRGYDEIWVHSMWLPRTMLACWKVIRAGKKLVRMTHANLDPLRYRYHGWKKRLVGPIERWLFKRTDRVVVTCEAEKEWCQKWGLRNEFEIVDLKRFFRLEGFDDITKLLLGEPSANTRYPLARTSLMSSSQSAPQAKELHLLYLGRRHPLKGVNYLEQAVEELKNYPHSNLNWQLELHCVSDHFGEELERDWDWCDVLVLPTLSENFGLVVAEALERGKSVITTDGAPAWEPPEAAAVPSAQCLVPSADGRLVYLKGYRDGTDEGRVKLLKNGLLNLARVAGFEPATN